MSYPVIIQGGMGVGVSNWVLANAVSKLNQLGVISGTFLDTVLTRRLQLGDLGGHIKRALDHFPNQDIAQWIYDKYFISGGKKEEQSFKTLPMYNLNTLKERLQLTVAGNFCEVFLAKEGHNNPVGINLLEKIQLPNLASIYGAMLAGIDYVIMGAGIPREIPGVLDKYVDHKETSIRIHVENATPEDKFSMAFKPKEVVGELPEPLKRPKFLAIVSSATLAISLKRKSTGKVDGFIIEKACAGGHNAPPRGKLNIDAKGEPVYGDKDLIDVEKINKLGLPFWLAGSYGDPAKVQEALDQGAQGVQIGTPFAFCNESGVRNDYKKKIIQMIIDGKAEVFTDPKASPTGYPFKVFQMEDTVSDKEVYEARPRVCDLGFLRTLVKQDNDKIIYRCPAEPADNFIRKSGDPKELEGRKCLCNGLLSGIGLAQMRSSGYLEKAIITAGIELSFVTRFLKEGELSYSAADVIDALCPQLELAATCTT